MAEEAAAAVVQDKMNAGDEGKVDDAEREAGEAEDGNDGLEVTCHARLSP